VNGYIRDITISVSGWWASCSHLSHGICPSHNCPVSARVYGPHRYSLHLPMAADSWEFTAIPICHELRFTWLPFTTVKIPFLPAIFTGSARNFQFNVQQLILCFYTQKRCWK